MELLVPNTPEYISIRNSYILLTKDYQKSQYGEFMGGMPVTLERDCLKPIIRKKNNEYVYYVTLKVDGERYLLYINTDGEGYYISRSLNIFKLTNIKFKVTNCLLDGELVSSNNKSYFILFDVLYYNSVNVIPADYYYRYSLITEFVGIQSSDYFKIKKWFNLGELFGVIVNNSNTNIYEYVKKNTLNELKIESDGLILQPFDTEYIPLGPWIKKGNIQFKWKPVDRQTIDFKIKIVDPNTWILLTKNGNPFMINQLKGNPLTATCKPTIAVKKLMEDGDVGEFRFIKDSLFKFEKKRPNKEANSISAAMSVMNFLNNPFTLDILLSNDRKKLLSLLTTKQLILNICKRVDYVSFFTQVDLSILELVFNKLKNDKLLEFEIRLYKSGGQGVKKYVFDNIFNYLSSNNLKFNYVNTIEILKGNSRSEYFLNENSKLINTNNITKKKEDLYSENTESIKKMGEYIKLGLVPKELIIPDINSLKKESKLDQTSYNELYYRFGLAKESPSKIIIQEINSDKSNNLVRAKNRISFYTPDSMWRIDLTVVKEGYGLRQAYSSFDKYEIEIEYYQNNNQNNLLIDQNNSFPFFVNTLNNILVDLLLNSNNCS